MDSSFYSTMRKAWGIHPDSEFTNLARNIYLVQFTTESELTRVTSKGIWSYRGEVVALKRIRGPEELATPTVDDMEVWAQIHRIPAHAITNEGVRMLGAQIGEPQTDAIEAYAGGMRFCRMRIRIPINKSLKETVSFTHPALGTFTLYVVYERITRLAMCLLCSC